MAKPSKATKKRSVLVFAIIILATFLLVIRLAYIQIVTGEELKRGALEQWTKDIEIKSKRGIIYDRNGKKLAISVSSYTIWASQKEIKEPNETAKIVAEILDMKEEDVLAKITEGKNTSKIKQWISKKEADKLKELNLPGIEIVDDNKRFYPYEDFASHILGFTNIDNDGLYGVEKIYDKYLTGTPGKWVKTTDAGGRQLPYDVDRVHDAKDGLNVVLTIDETIQHFAEDLAKDTQTTTEAKNVSVLVMEPQTGDILAMASMPQYNPNNPRDPLTEEMKEDWKDLSDDELQNRWYDIWRNFTINDFYEPGSTFKTIVAAAAIEENIANENTSFYCDGIVKDIPGVKRGPKCHRSHESQTLTEAMESSCNVAFANLGRMLGKEKLHKYMRGFGFGELTGIELTGEQGGIIHNTDSIKEINLATMAFGQGVAVTPIQLISAISAIGNGGNLMTPRIVSQLMDNDGNVVLNNEAEIKRQVISKETSDVILKMMESVVSEGTGGNAYVPGYKVAGKTGTSQKVIEGMPGYAPGKYIGSFIGLAPSVDPRIAVLVIVDEPEGVYYGGSVAAPLAGKLIDQTLSYLEVQRQYTEKEEEELKDTVEVPDLIDKTIEEIRDILIELDLKYTTESYDIKADSKVINQFPLPGEEVLKRSTIDLYFNEESKRIENIEMPNLMGKTKDEAAKLLNQLNIRYEFKGEGLAIKQKPEAEEKINIDSNVTIEFSEDEE